MENQLPQRKINRLQEYNYSQNGAYFITICCKNMQCILGEIVGDAVFGVPNINSVPTIKLSKYGLILQDLLENIDNTKNNLQVPYYVIMPNHIHLIVEIDVSVNTIISGTPKTASPTKNTLAKFVNALKGLSTKRARENIWQRSFYDHVIRNDKDYARIVEYIQGNPYNWQKDCYFVL